MILKFPMVMLWLCLTVILTLILEFPIIWISFGRRTKNKMRLFGNFVLINAITNLCLNAGIVFDTYYSVGFGSSGILIAELIIPAIEAVMFRYATKEISWKRLLITCYIANAVSFLVGNLIMSM